MQKDITRQIEAQLSELRPSERKVAECVLVHVDDSLAQPDSPGSQPRGLQSQRTAQRPEVDLHLAKLNRGLQSLRGDG